MKVPPTDVLSSGVLRRLADAVNALDDGKGSNTGTVTLVASAASTTVSDRRVGINSVITWMPTTGNAAAEVGNGTVYVSAITAGQFTVTHANNAQTDRTFKYEVTG